MSTSRVGNERVSGFWRVVGAILYFGLIGWVFAGVATILAAIFAIVDIAMRIVLNRRLNWGESWPRSVFDWNVDLLYWMFFGRPFPGLMGFVP